MVAEGLLITEGQTLLMTGSKIFGEELNLKNLGRDLFSDLNPIMTTKCMNP